MPMYNPAAYAAGSNAATRELGMAPASPPKPPGAPGFQTANQTAATAPRPPQLTPPRVQPLPGMPPTPSAQVAAATLPLPTKQAGFSLSHRPEERAQESQAGDARVRQPATNETRRTAEGIQSAFQSLQTPSESDPYTIARMF